MKGHVVLAFAVALLWTRLADADEPTHDAPTTTSPKRSVPSYDGRPPAATPLGTSLLWVPRVLLSPLYFVSEFVLRRPLAAAVPAAEKIDLPEKIYDFFLFGKDHKAGILPVGYIEFDFKPSVGIYAFWDDAGFKGNDLSLHTEVWPDDWIGVSLQERILIDERHTVQLRVSELHRPDRLFYGIGPNALEASESRYGIQQAGGEVSYEWRFWRSSRVETRVGVRDVSVFNGNYGGDPDVTAAAARGAFPIPYGFGREYTAEYNRVTAAVDTRAFESRRRSGVRLELDGEQGNDVRNTAEWIRYGATAAAYADLTGTRRVVSLSLTTQFADPFGQEPIPFTELVSLGGDHAMRGFFSGRLLGRSAAAATAGYSWPIGPWLNGDLQLAVGNVFDEHLAGFDAGALRFSGAFGLSIQGFQKNPVMGSQDAPVELLVGIGSETFDHGGQIDSLRVLFGMPYSF